MSGRHDRILGAAFLALGAGLLASARALPPGVGRVPGPGFVPGIVGGVMLVLALALLWQSRRPRTAAPDAPATAIDVRGTLGVVGLLAVYLLLWGLGPFALRTTAFLLVLLRIFGQPWRPALAVSLTLSAAVLVVFQLGLGVSLD